MTTFGIARTAGTDRRHSFESAARARRLVSVRRRQSRMQDRSCLVHGT